MGTTNYERVGKALRLLREGLGPYVKREMRSVHGDRWVQVAWQSLHGFRPSERPGEPNWDDVQTHLKLMWEQWNSVFKRTLGHAERALVSELRDVRNRWAHQEAFSTDDAYRAIDSVGRLLQAVSAEEVSEVEKLRMAVLRARFEDQRRSEMRKRSMVPTDGRPIGGLACWREVVTPHQDVLSGQYQQAEFAADLWQVYIGEGSSEYRDPVEFFRRTFLTEGLTRLLVGALRRIAGVGGDPVVELQTNFGGGKTHSLLALYHLFSGVRASELPGVEGLVQKAGVDIESGVKRAALVGNRIAPGKKHEKRDGTVVQTLWGELAWQLGGKEGYAIVQEADKTSTNPGDLLRVLFNKFAPCLILIDEWVAYARQLHDDIVLPAGTFDTQFTFAQALTESVKASPRALLVVSIPASESEAGGDQGRAALRRLKNVIGRLESPWRPASPDEGFEIVRRRLFEPIVDNEKFKKRDAVARAFSDMYRTQHQEYPTECREADYERRIKAAYPIHPELFDRLYTDWSALEKFQRTRGVLRLMAAVIHSLWERQESNLLIQPGNVPLDDTAVSEELRRHLDENWAPVMDKDVDGPHSLPLEIDRELPNLGRYSACRRVARTVFMGSAPLQDAANLGIDDRHVNLGCAQPGESVATFGDALRRLADSATYLYVDKNRYWYSTQPAVTRLAQDRASQFREEDVVEQIQERLRREARSRGAFSKVHPCVSSSDIPDEMEARLVILGPRYTHSKRMPDSPAMQQAKAILEARGNIPRNYKNTLVFLAADEDRLGDLDQAIRQFLAWKSICEEAETLNLSPFQARQAKGKLEKADETVDVRIPEAYRWLIAPRQPDPHGPVEWDEIQLRGGGRIAERASKKLQNEGTLLDRMAGTILRRELDRIPLWRGDHVGVKQLAEDFAKYLYLPRLKDTRVLLDAIKDGLAALLWEQETFAYADAWDEQKKRYLGLCVAKAKEIAVNPECVIVKPDVASRQIRSDKMASEAEGEGTGASKRPVGTPGADEGAAPSATVEPKPGPPRRFHGTVRLDWARVSRDAGQVAEEVIQHLVKLEGSKVEITLEVQAQIPGGAPDDVVRTVSENCRTLKFEHFAFEKE